MNVPLLIAWLLCVFLGAWWLTSQVLRYALAKRLLDIPNERSSHSVATPRGGGTAMVVATLATLPLAASLEWLPWAHVWAVTGAGALVAGIGFVDDRRHLRRRWRLLGHVAAAIWVLAWLGGLPLHVFGATADLGWIRHFLAALYIVWLINLTNFMDGIDGIAATEAVTVAACGALLFAVTVQPGDRRWIEPALLSAAAGGFLLWNWPPAKIFMGDSGSGFLGLVLATLSLQAAWATPALFWSWVILMGVFVVDATVTLLRRAFGRKPFLDPHRTHAYQHAAVRVGAHKPVTIAVAAINLFWLFPLAFLVARGSLSGLTGVLVAYAPLIVAAASLGAGVQESSRTRLVDARHV
jgi:Fuc2NAc and GlcNAc transferase